MVGPFEQPAIHMTKRPSDNAADVFTRSPSCELLQARRTRSHGRQRARRIRQSIEHNDQRAFAFCSEIAGIGQRGLRRLEKREGFAKSLFDDFPEAGGSANDTECRGSVTMKCLHGSSLSD